MLSMMGKGQPLSSNFTFDEEAKASEKLGIVSILGSNIEKTDSTNPSLHRTLSADMSSKNWLAQNGLPSGNMISLSQELLASNDNSYLASLEEEDLEEERLVIWNSIKEAHMKEDQELEKAKDELTSWNSILSQRGEDLNSVPPYVHPLVRRSSSTLSKKSLEVCTESLGAETGSYGLSSYPLSAEDGKAGENHLDRAKPTTSKEDQNNYPSSKKSTEFRAFPPPLPSLSRENGALMSMRSSRSNGRLFLEAVSVENNFQAQRHEGRLILNFVDNSSAIPQEVEKDEESELDEGSDDLCVKCEDEESEHKEEVEMLEAAETRVCDPLGCQGS
ncbi:hypothetical protein SAY86_022804 [Trapa natans]|nr:hypothetical protein SAY86_022804 [Trapa natans]